MSLLMAKLFPVFTALAANNSVKENSFMSGVIAWAAGIGGGIVGLFLIISLVKDGIGFAKGQGDSSIFKIIGKALFLILIIGLIFLAVNYKSLGDKAKTIGDTVINTVDNEATNIMNSAQQP